MVVILDNCYFSGCSGKICHLAFGVRTFHEIKSTILLCIDFINSTNLLSLHMLDCLCHCLSINVIITPQRALKLFVINFVLAAVLRRFVVRLPDRHIGFELGGIYERVP